MSGGWLGGERGVDQFAEIGVNEPSVDGPGLAAGLSSAVVGLAIIAAFGSIGYVALQFVGGGPN